MIKGVKICGVSDLKTLNFITRHSNPPNFIGFITNYKKSKRYVTIETLKKLTDQKKYKTNFVSVLVEPEEEILKSIKNFKFDYFQLYNVDPDRTKYIKKKYEKKIITALTVDEKKDVDRYIFYENISDIILFDGKGYEKSISFEHRHLDDISKNISVMIAGNISINNIPIIKNLDYFIDISGSLEDQYGNKDLKKIDNFLNNVYQNET